ncbi:transmembrane 4 L6 family member 4 [Callorhinchus milii]|uniref:Transmembrane 4 L six family member 4 n=1 Tax=Callorhinchus milii TaxID=7868 RepID=V9LAH9_CALMI|nr:transmembrane 4 L6 family member 4 [Callorhinchus milii]|eukprot:gi/632968627/ref/XP_007900629.1/ PREDICTED: transmembrane 4 L6 family member 4-like [Callorhinchus milii]
MCTGKCAKCLGITLIPLALLCIIANTLLFFPNGETRYNTQETLASSVWCMSGIIGSGILMVFPALVFLGMEKNDCCGCCGNESCGKRFANFSSVIFAAVGVAGAAYCFIVSAVGIHDGPKCALGSNTTFIYPFENGNYLSNHTLWEKCSTPKNIVPWHLTLFSLLLLMSAVQLVLCAFQVINGLIGFICGDCCNCCSSE